MNFEANAQSLNVDGHQQVIKKYYYAKIIVKLRMCVDI